MWHRATYNICWTGFFSFSISLWLIGQIPTGQTNDLCQVVFLFFKRYFCILNMHRDRFRFHKEIYFLIFIKYHHLQLPSFPRPHFLECKKYFLWFCCRIINNMHAMMKRQLKRGLSWRGQSEKEPVKLKRHITLWEGKHPLGTGALQEYELREIRFFNRTKI